jgi:hypothetical protein
MLFLAPRVALATDALVWVRVRRATSSTGFAASAERRAASASASSLAYARPPGLAMTRVEFEPGFMLLALQPSSAAAAEIAFIELDPPLPAASDFRTGGVLNVLFFLRANDGFFFGCARFAPVTLSFTTANAPPTTAAVAATAALTLAPTDVATRLELCPPPCCALLPRFLPPSTEGANRRTTKSRRVTRSLMVKEACVLPLEKQSTRNLERWF